MKSISTSFKHYYIIATIAIIALLVFTGCKNSNQHKTDIKDIILQIEPLKIILADGSIRSITLQQALDFHSNHELHSSANSNTPDSHSDHLCMGVTIGYQAIRYAVEELYGKDIPLSTDFQITLNSDIDGVWDIINLYTDKQDSFQGQAAKFGYDSYRFSASSASKGKTIEFYINKDLIPQEFFDLKNQGATCSDIQFSKIKQKALLNILSTKPQNNFINIDGQLLFK